MLPQEKGSSKQALQNLLERILQLSEDTQDEKTTSSSSELRGKLLTAVANVQEDMLSRFRLFPHVMEHLEITPPWEMPPFKFYNLVMLFPLLLPPTIIGSLFDDNLLSLIEAARFQDMMHDLEKATYAVFNSLSASDGTQGSDETLSDVREQLNMMRQALDALHDIHTAYAHFAQRVSEPSTALSAPQKTALISIRQASQRLHAMHGLMAEAEAMLDAKQHASEALASETMAWQEPGARNNPSNYWDAYCNTEQMLFDYLAEEKEHTALSTATWRLYLNDMTFYLGSSVYATLLYESHLAFEDNATQAQWLAAALCLHVLHRHLKIPWHPDDIIGQVVTQIEQPALRILEALDPKLAALVSGNVLDGNLKYFGQNLRQESFAFLESVGVLSLLPIIMQGLRHELRALQETLSPYLDTQRYARNLQALRRNLAWRSECSQILRQNLHAMEQAEAQARFAASVSEVVEQVMAWDDELEVQTSSDEKEQERLPVTPSGSSV